MRFRAPAACLALALLAATTWAARSPRAWAGDPGPDAVVLANGESLDCRVLSREQDLLRVHRGGRTYELERSSLRSIARGEGPALAPRLLDWVAALALRQHDVDARIAASAAAALTALGAEARLYLNELIGAPPGVAVPQAQAERVRAAATAALARLDANGVASADASETER